MCAAREPERGHRWGDSLLALPGKVVSELSVVIDGLTRCSKSLRSMRARCGPAPPLCVELYCGVDSTQLEVIRPICKIVERTIVNRAKNERRNIFRCGRQSDVDNVNATCPVLASHRAIDKSFVAPFFVMKLRKIRNFGRW